VRIVRIFTPVVIGIIITSALLVDFATAAGSPNINSPSFTIMYVDAHATTGAGGGLDWTRFSALDSSFPRGASSYGGSGGSSTHSHTTSSNNYQISTITGSTRKSGGTSDAGDHYHITVGGNTDTAKPYLEVVPRQQLMKNHHLLLRVEMKVQRHNHLLVPILVKVVEGHNKVSYPLQVTVYQ